ncbi:hypothetical protein GCM10012319_65930 [Comamonas sp. KCTC 72670]|nr:hypothetical protein GCM10012319_65930 [Comamonas sp. KCTC 72670]
MRDSVLGAGAVPRSAWNVLTCRWDSVLRVCFASSKKSFTDARGVAGFADAAFSFARGSVESEERCEAELLLEGAGRLG